MAYKVIASKEVEEAIDNIHNYIATVLLSPQSAKNTVAKILDSLKSLEIFPDNGLFIVRQLTTNCPVRYCIARFSIIIFSIFRPEKISCE